MFKYSKKDIESVIEFTLKNDKDKPKNIFKKWLSNKNNSLSKEELDLLKGYKIQEIDLGYDSKLLIIRNTLNNQTEHKTIDLILDKYGAKTYHKFYNDDYASYQDKMIIINWDKLDGKYTQYKDDKHMKYHKKNGVLIFEGPDYCPHDYEENKDVYSKFDKYCFKNLIPMEGYQSYFDDTLEYSR